MGKFDYKNGINYEVIHAQAAAHSALAAMELSKQPTMRDVLSQNIEPVLEQNEKVVNALIENNKQLIKANELKEIELEEARKDSKSTKKWTIATFVVALLSLLVAVVTWFV